MRGASLVYEPRDITHGKRRVVESAVTAAPSRRENGDTGEGKAWRAKRIETAREPSKRGRAGCAAHYGRPSSAAIAASALLEFAHIFESDFDFTADALSGDRFRSLAEMNYANGVQPGPILAAQFLFDADVARPAL